MQAPKKSNWTLKRFGLYSAIVIVAGLTILYIGGFWYLRNAYKFEYANPSFLSAVANDIRTTSKLPTNFKDIESKITKQRLTYKSQYKDLFFANVLFLSSHRLSNLPGNFSKEVYEIEKKKYNRGYTWRLFVDEALVYSFGFEKEFGLDQLSDFYYNNCEHQILLDSNKHITLYGIQAISNYKFGKLIDSLNTDQLVELYFLSGDKSRDYFLYDSLRYSARLKVLKKLSEREL